MTRLNGAKRNRGSSPGIDSIPIPEPEIVYPGPCLARLVWKFPATDVSRMLADVRFRMGDRQEKRSKGKRCLGRNVSSRYHSNLLQAPPRDKRVIGLELLHRLAPRVWEKLGQHAGFRPVAQPQFTGKPEMGKALDLIAEVEILPRMEIPGERYRGVQIYVPAQAIVSETQIRHAIEERRFYFATYLAKNDPDVTIGRGDFVALNIQERAAGAADWGPTNQAQIVLGRGQARMEIEEKLIGLKTGQTLGLTVCQDDREIEISIVIADHKVGHLPDDAELCAAEAMADMAALEYKMEQFLSAQAERRYQNSLRERMLATILGGTSFPMPPSMIAARGQMLKQGRMLQAAARQGQKYLDTPEEQQRCQEIATRLVQEEYALYVIAAQEGISVGDGDISSEILRMATTDGQPPAEIRARIEKGNLMEQLRQQVLFNKTVSWLIQQAKIQEEVII